MSFLGILDQEHLQAEMKTLGHEEPDNDYQSNGAASSRRVASGSAASRYPDHFNQTQASVEANASEMEQVCQPATPPLNMKPFVLGAEEVASSFCRATGKKEQVIHKNRAGRDITALP